jgi:septation ring formation regulator EzrA
MEEVENNGNTSTLPPELQAEKDYLLQKLKEIAEVKNGYVFVENEAGSRKRFVSRAEILNI